MDLSGTTLLGTGTLLLLLGGVLAYARSVPLKAYGYLRSRFIFSVEILQDDEAFNWVLGWLDSHPSVANSKRLTVRTRRRERSDVARAIGGVPDPIEISYSPLGTHWMRHRGRFMWIERNRERQKGEGGLFLGFTETLTISTIQRRRGFIEEVILEARGAYEAKRQGNVVIYSLSQYGDWNEIARKRQRRIDSVILAEGIVDRTLGDIRRFEARLEWYHDVGVPYRRGFLLYGPPGNGKTSLVFAIASELDKNIAVISLATPSLTDEGLRASMARMPENSILLIEDLDGVFVQRKAATKDMKLTFSGLLNALDGVATSEGRIMFVTTNFVDRLDPALIRAGRVDVQVSIELPNAEQVAELYRRFLPDREYRAGPDGLSMAAYQERFLQEVES